MAETEDRDLLADVGAAFDEVESGGAADAGSVGDAGEVRPKPEGAVADAPARARDETGKFTTPDKAAPPPRETLKVKDPTVAAAVTQEIAATGAAKTPEERAQSERMAPPTEWKGAGKVQWDKLPAQVQAQIHEDHRAVMEMRQTMAPLQQALAPYRDVFVRDAGSMENAVSQLGQFYNLYLTRTEDLIQHIAATRGIDLRQLVARMEGQPGQGIPQQQGRAPDLASLIRHFVQQEVAPIQSHFQQTETQQLQSVIDAFGSDPKHPYFNDVKVHMGRLMGSGAATDMQDAYDQATWANPAIRQQLLEQQAEAQKKTQAAQVAKARQAGAVNLSGSPLAGATSGQQGSRGKSVLDSVRATFAQMEEGT